MKKISDARHAEWLEADGLGGFASGTVSGVRTRRYHALLLSATQPPVGRFVLVNGFDAIVETPDGESALSSQCYAPGVTSPDGNVWLESFDHDPWPRWVFALPGGIRIAQEIFVRHGEPAVAISWQLLSNGPLKMPVRLRVRPFLSGRDYHSLHHENSAFAFEPEIKDERVVWRPYAGVPAICALTNGNYRHEAHWYRNFLYEEERARGLDCSEDLAAPGLISFELHRQDAVLIFGTELDPDAGAADWYAAARANERTRRSRFATPLHRAADAYLVKRGEGQTIVAGYPWFTDWGRDTFIALRGICLATGWLEEAREILLHWAGAVDSGMLPNRFPDRGEAPEFNSVDASLWYVIAVHEFLKVANVPDAERDRLEDAVEAILSGFEVGTRFRIGADADGLLACGEPGVQLTWMDAKVGDWVVTPRIGKPVEIQALWLNALGCQKNPRWRELFERGLASFRARFWNAEASCLYDVVDVDHRPGVVDASFRPNQIFAVGGLPIALFEGAQARSIVNAVEERLWTRRGLRSLGRGEHGYAPHYQGGVAERDGSYHQGTVWPWLTGAFVEAWVRVRGNSAAARREAREKFVEPMRGHLDEAGLGHISEIADAEEPHTPRGCPFQAWSVGELLRIEQLLAEPIRIRSTAGAALQARNP
jgi:predicted glycogen debranching enzyme